MYYTLIRNGVRYTVRIVKVSDVNPSMVYVDISELQRI